MLIAVEFGFGSDRLPPEPRSFFAEIGTTTLKNSVPPKDVPPVRWIERVHLLHEACVNRQNFLVWAAEGCLDRRSIYGGLQFSKNKVVCGRDSRLGRKLNVVLFNISHAGQTDTKGAFQYTSANLTIRRIARNEFGFRGGGDIDFDVDGSLDLSSGGFNQRKFVYDVSGCCTSFESGDGQSAGGDLLVYCYLTDNDRNRFIVPGIIADNSPVKTPSLRSIGQELHLEDSSRSFRAEYFDYLKEESAPRDGDHLAAIKTLALVFPARQNLLDEAAVPLLLPAITRTFCISTLFGATSLRNTTETLAEGDWIERATMRDWALAMLIALVGVSGLAGAGLKLLRRKDEGWNIPVNFNSAAGLSAEDGDVITDGSGKYLQCGLRYDGGKLCYGVLGELQEPVNVRALERTEPA